MRRPLLLPFAFCLLPFCSAAGESVLVIEQDYNMVGMGAGGVDAKDVRQRIYVGKDWLCIDEMGPAGKGAPTESIFIDLKGRKIVNLNHTDGKKTTEDFDKRRKKIDEKKNEKRADIADLPPGGQKDRVEKLWRALLDDRRKFSLVKNPAPAKKIAGINCPAVKVNADDQPGYVPLEGFVHPDLELPYDNAEVLYLLMIIGEKMSDFLKKNREVFKHVPMELHLDLAAGGTLDTKVVSFERVDKDSLDLRVRGALGSPFTIPDYPERTKASPAQPKPEPVKASTPDEKPRTAEQKPKTVAPD